MKPRKSPNNLACPRAVKVTRATKTASKLHARKPDASPLITPHVEGLYSIDM